MDGFSYRTAPELSSASAFNRLDHKPFDFDALLSCVCKCFTSIVTLIEFRSFFLHCKISHFFSGGFLFNKGRETILF
jgi:hypothetical protein